MILENVLKCERCNTWIKYEKMSLYIRIGKRLIEGKLTPCVQLANMSLYPEYQHKGTFTRLLADILRLTDKPVYVELLLNRDFYEALIRRGFVPAHAWEDVVLLRTNDDQSRSD